MMGSRYCSICGGKLLSLETKTTGTWYCPNCDQYPWMIQPMTEEEVIAQDSVASKIARRGSER